MATLDIVIALVPVIVFLSALLLMDSFRLVRPAAILSALAWGAIAAAASLWLNDWLLRAHHVPAGTVSRYIAPVTEETAKALLLVVLVSTSRVGFLVDAAVQGFAVGTGFALIENLTYLHSMPDAPVIVWVVRGLGTAMLQGAATTIFAMISKTLVDRRAGRPALAFVPGWAAAVVIHSTFNHRLLPPVAQTLVILIVLPLLVLWVFARSERATRDWIGAGMDLDVELLNLVGSEDFAFTHFGRYLQELRARVPGPVVADMFCLLRLELELSVQAKALLLAREAGLDVPVDDDLEASLAERRYLQRSIGKMGLLALKPLQVTSRRDQWHRHLLQQRGARRPRVRSSA
jgi:RsiW-degrading membrane proteinase PrsW (M82 family)